ncbi:magnesium-dependent phosphatase 1-like [Microplitis mediator]|uniref:magnesium-dependent phosphatase 1-like n=1 Tax=Microplitis mediator TaxID=375433 RepID=UPI002557417D|nr:magnesium-dependent phosphatase 1-like [Microplitis mediator]
MALMTFALKCIISEISAKNVFSRRHLELHWKLSAFCDFILTYKEGYEITIASRTAAEYTANQLLELLEWDKNIKYKQIYAECKLTHFVRIEIQSGVIAKDMILFDAVPLNIRELKALGVLSILVINGLNKDLIKYGLEKFSSPPDDDDDYYYEDDDHEEFC